MDRYRWLDPHQSDFGLSSEIGEAPGDFGFFRFPVEELEARRLPEGSEPKRVCVIGAGIAGLTAAYELATAGHDVVVVEADDRVGGRIRTWEAKCNGHNVVGELGPMRIPPNHLGTLHYLEEMGFEPVPFVQHNPKGLFHLRGSRKQIGTWKELLDAYGGDPDYLFPGLRFDPANDDPERLIQRVMQHAKSKLKTAEMWRVVTGDLAPAAKVLGSMTVWQLMMGMLADLSSDAGPWLPPIPGTGRLPSIPPFRWFSPLGWELIGRATGYMWEERISALEACIEDVAVTGTRRWRLEEGMEALPREMAARLRAKGVRIDLKTAVTRVAVKSLDRIVEVHAGDKPIKTNAGKNFTYAICAVPASASSRIEFDPVLSPTKYEALTNLTYMSAAKALVMVRQRVWEHDDDIYGGASYTDMPIQQVWYPSDNARALDDEASYRATRSQDIGEGEQVETSPTSYGPRSRNGWKQPAILTGAYMTGINAERFCSLGEAHRTELVLSCLDKLHPGIRRDVVDVSDTVIDLHPGLPVYATKARNKAPMRHCVWIEQTTPEGGAWTFLAPGAHERYQDSLCEPHPKEASRVFFAGEHLCVLHGWMQSAIQASLEAAMAVMSAP